MALQGPRKTPAGYFLKLTPSVAAPEVRWADGAWVIAEDWVTWAAGEREARLAELLAHPQWFSRPPRQDILGPIFGPWAGTNMSGKQVFTVDLPEVPGNGQSGKATWLLDGLMMTSVAIKPIFTVETAVPDADSDRISLFGDGETVASEESDADGGETREIQFEEIELGSPAGSAPTKLRSREWEARKFLAKERVREARLKAQIAARLADKEERRYYAQFGELDDSESHFSDYDLTDDEAASEAGSSADA